jgi:hypothetical protein
VCHDTCAWYDLICTNVGDDDGTIRADAQLRSVGRGLSLGCLHARAFQLPQRSGIREKEQSMRKRLVTRYAMRSAEAADENQRRVEGVFDELAATKPDNVSYIVLRLADDSFVHVSFHNHGDDEPNPIASTAAFAHFQEDHADRREGGVDQQTATLVGAYITAIE